MTAPPIRPLPDAAGGILSYFTRHRTAANLLMVLLIVAGLFAAPNMRAQFFPDVVIDNVTVGVRWEGAGAEDVDAGIVEVLEPALMAIEGIESASSVSEQDNARIVLDFEPGWDMSRAADDVRQAIDSVTTLPEEIDEPTVRRGVWWDRVTDVVISGPVAPEQVALYGDELVARLFDAGVTRTSIFGVAAPRILVEVPSVSLMAHDISMVEIASAIAAEVDAAPAGDVTGANARVRTGTEKRTVRDIAGIVLRTQADGTTIRVGDVATVIQEGSDRNKSLFVRDDPAVSLRIDRSASGDAIEIQRRVEEIVAEFQSTLPRGVEAQMIRTRAEAISGRLDILFDNGLLGLSLVVALLFLFLNARTAFWVAAGIPVAMLAAVALMYLGGLTINMVSLFGLIITLGIVVDDAIVVGEHADARARRYGEAPVVAAENAARRMAMPVFAATLTTIIAFFGMTAIDGRFGDLIADIPFTVIAVLAASLMECFLILPHHMAGALASAGRRAWYDWPSRTVNRGFQRVRESVFRPLMAGVIHARYAVLAGAVLVLASQVVLVIREDVQWRFFSAPERGSVTGNFVMANGATREDSIAMMQEMQRATDELAAEYASEHGRNPISFVFTEIGGNAWPGIDGTENKDPDLLGAISIELIDPDLRPYSSFAFVGELQERVVQHPLAETVSFRGWRSGPGGEALHVQFYGAEADVLKAASEDLRVALAQYPEVSAVQDNLAYDKEELVLELTAQGRALGFTVGDLSRLARNRLAGIEAATFPEGSRSAEIRVELPEEELSADFLERTLLRAPGGAYVPLADIVTVERRTGFSTVRRENGIRVIEVTGDVSEDDPARATEIERRLAEEILPWIAAERQVDWQLAGLSEQEDEFLSGALNGFVLCVTGIYLALAWVFASWTRPLVVIAIIPFGLVGAIFGHHVWDVPMSMFSVVGLLGMTGIIINDSIVLVTTIDQYRADRPLVPSIIDGAADRLRPVLLTTLTTVLGLVPLLYETSSQAQWLKPTVITLVYGLGFGMLLVLLVVPALMAVQHDIGSRVRSMHKATRARRARGLQALLLTLWAAVLGWGAVTLGAVMVTGDLPALLSAGDAGTAMGRALAVFLAGAAVLCLLGYVIGALGLMIARRRAA